ncbi:MAG: NFACT RNA binding domain-containing protein [Armatimonadota bacterium]|nr:NFACT RNA binding domain-containing protein [Armatimonadota bacterium]
MPERIPYDAMILSAVLKETAGLVGSYIDRIRALDDSTIIVRTREVSLLVSADPRAPRFYPVTSAPKSADVGGFFRLAKDRMENGRIDALEQIGFDRRFRLVAKGHELVVDLMGTRANMTLLGSSGAAGRLRRITPPMEGGPTSLSEAVTLRQGLSKVLMNELDLIGDDDLIAKAEHLSVVYYAGVGAYPFPLASIAAKPMQMAHLGNALEKYYSDVIPQLENEALARTLRGQLESARKARVKSLAQIDEVLDTAGRARKLQTYGELILAYMPEGAAKFETVDYEGSAIEIALDSEKTPVENAARYFSKAKKAKNAAGDLAPKAERTRRELALIEGWLATLPEGVQSVAESARASGMLRDQQPPPEKREVRHEGHRVRETEIDGYVVVWGENATANDFVTTRIAKPNDYWLHVRGAHGSHVVLKTNNKPERVAQEILVKAAKIAAKTSNQKHAMHVPVTVTLAKYVRKPRKSAPGAVTFTNDKTLFVDP